MFRALTFFFFLIVSVFGQTQQMGFNELPHLPFGTQNLKNPSVADQNPSNDKSNPNPNYLLDFLGASKPSSALIVNDRWNIVGTYSILFFSFVLNVFLILKLWKYRRRKTRLLQP